MHTLTGVSGGGCPGPHEAPSSATAVQAQGRWGAGVSGGAAAHE
jgi:hypothetical protein